MRTIEIRRHCLTKKGAGRGSGSQLSAAGVAQARRIGDDLGAFDWVLTSCVSRSLETAIAMGYAVDEQLEALGNIPLPVWDEIGHQERWAWEQPFMTFADFIRSNGPTTRLGECQRDAWANAMERVPADGRVLVISHGRVIEAGLVTAVPGGNFAEWGPPFQHGEGIQMCYEDGKFHDPIFRRLERSSEDAEPQAPR